MKLHIDELASKVGRDLAVSDWLTVDQDRINRFADAIGDHQWIHVDVERARAGPYGAPIAHGYLTLSLLSIFLDPILDFDGVSMRVNYGIDRVRFPAPVPVDSRIRAHVAVESLDETPQGVRVELRCVLEIEGTEKPACVAHPVALLVRAEAEPVRSVAS
jgi:acyl dehydratase